MDVARDAVLGLSFDEITPTSVRGSVAADERRHRPWGIVHGGLHTAVVETFATTGAYEAVEDHGQQAVGVANATDFLRPHRSGRLDVEAVAISQGRTQQLWQVAPIQQGGRARTGPRPPLNRGRFRRADGRIGA
ncbi:MULTISPECIES: PaaI family thioesterase [unclassified Saccharopolyspora]|uniref:PaaI family thioesterase n=1 Tax=unclassified Saccharopolyspora TaxID=2646250 RepID=UPI001CD2C346|nr:MULTISPECIES: PaaI family thioesterase [unclassified Saccharopolyspora]MCA1188673.1 PaaI family thioesterase [Saccharopolyspora sp. 6T]MCA1194390.1 PaaI family thioesterase [Saccharopolyspora sp. 6V]